MRVSVGSDWWVKLLSVFTIILGVSSCSASSFDNSILNEPAAKYFRPGEAQLTVTQLWGIPLSDASGPRSLKEVTEEIFYYLEKASGGAPITVGDIETGFLPGNTLNSIFSRLVNDQRAFDAIYSYMLSLAR